jgi:hypothetical protein
MTSRLTRRALIVCLSTAAALLGGAASAVLGVCGPFTDVTDPAFCPFVLEVFYSAITTGTLWLGSGSILEVLSRI